MAALRKLNYPIVKVLIEMAELNPRGSVLKGVAEATRRLLRREGGHCASQVIHFEFIFVYGVRKYSNIY